MIAYGNGCGGVHGNDGIDTCLFYQLAAYIHEACWSSGIYADRSWLTAPPAVPTLQNKPANQSGIQGVSFIGQELTI
jgi:hypothetical protein